MKAPGRTELPHCLAKNNLHVRSLNIYLLEKHKVEFLKLLDEIQIDSNDLELVLKSEILTLFEKIKILDACEIDEMENHYILENCLLQ